MTARASRSRSISKARRSAARRSPSDINADIFRREIARARTFGFMRDVERLWAAGYALGSSLENSVVIGDDNRVINMEGLRYPDEFVRHKTLDAMGDLALAGARFIGCFRSYRGGHRLNAAALRQLLSDRRRSRSSRRHAANAAVRRDDRRQRAGLCALDALILNDFLACWPPVCVAWMHHGLVKSSISADRQTATKMRHCRR